LYAHFKIRHLDFYINDPNLLNQKYDKEVTVICLYNERDGSHWRFKEGDSYTRAKCRRGRSLDKKYYSVYHYVLY